MVSGGTSCSSNCDVYQYGMTGEAAQSIFAMTCAAVDDLGKTIPGTEEPMTAYQGQMCGQVTEGPCTAAEAAQVVGFCATGSKLMACDRRCQTVTSYCSVDLPYETANACTQAFTTGGTHYESMAQYCTATLTQAKWHDCERHGLNVTKSTSLSGSSSRGRLVEGSTTADLGAYVTSKAKTAFASGKYLMEAIVFDPAFDCTLGKGQSHATNIIQVVGDRSHVFSLCAPYAPALAGVSGFAQALIHTQFSVTTRSDEQITSVVVEGRDGSKRTLVSSQFQYDSSTQVLTVKSSTLRATDAMMHVEITSACRPRIY
jgi:hypothetical protein